MAPIRRNTIRRGAHLRAAAMTASVTLAVGAVALTAVPAYAADFTVTNTDDSGMGSLRQAITDANTNPDSDVITISATGTVALVTDLPTIIHPVSIEGPGPASFIIDAAAGAGHGIFIDGSADPGIDVSISGLTVQNADEDGIRAEDADVTLSNVSILHSDEDGLHGQHGSFDLDDVFVQHSDGDGIDLRLDGASNAADLTNVSSRDSEFEGVQAELSNGASLAIEDSFVADNDSAGISIDGTASTATVTGTTVSNNNDTFDSQCGGGLHAVLEASVLTVANTLFIENEAEEGGGACVVSQASAVTFDGVTFEDNWGEEVAGGLFLDVPSGPSPVVIQDSVFVRNDSMVGGGMYINDPGEDGAYGGIQILRSTFDSNWAEDWAGAIGIEDMSPTGQPGVPSVLIQDSTISNNESDGSAAGLAVFNDFDASDDDVPFIVVENSTFTGNWTDDEGGGSIEATTYFSDPDRHPFELYLLNSTVSGNEAGGQSGEVAIGGNVALLVRNSIVAGNGGDDLFSIAQQGGDEPSAQVDYSMVGTTAGDAVTTAFVSGAGNIASTTPGLGPLNDNGGPTLTLLPDSSSAAVNAGDPAYTGLSGDQRGEARVSGGRIDMGAVEVQQGLAATGVDATPALVGGLLLLLAGGALVTGSRRPRRVR